MTDGISSCDDCVELDPLTMEEMPVSESVFGEWTCSNCPRPPHFSAEAAMARKIAFMLELKEAGYPFSADDLTPDEWRLLGACAAAVRYAAAEKAFKGRAHKSECEEM